MSNPAALVRFSPSVPEPVPVLAVTVQLVPEPLTLVMEAPARLPPATRVKLEALKPVTGALKVTSQLSELALVGLALLRVMEATIFWVVNSSTPPYEVPCGLVA